MKCIWGEIFRQTEGEDIGEERLEHGQWTFAGRFFLWQQISCKAAAFRLGILTAGFCL